MALSKDDILNAIADMSVMDVVELVSAMEEKFGVSAAAAVAAAPAAAGGGEEAAEQTEFTVFMSSFGGNKISVIKAVRALTGLGLKEAKGLVESAPCAVKKALRKQKQKTLRSSLKKLVQKLNSSNS